MNESVKIIENGIVFTGDRQNRAGQFTILIQNERIIDIGKPAQVLRAMYPSAEVIDATGKILMPCFIDAHHTGESFLLRYLTMDLSMSKWSKDPSFQKAIEYLKKDASYEELNSLYRLSFYSAIKSGVTTLSEFGIDNPEHSFRAAFDAMQQTNIKGFIGLQNGDQIETARILKDKSIRYALVIADEENLTTYNLQSSLRLARELQWPIILHLGQSKRACEIVKKNFNKSIAKLYNEFHIFDTPIQLLHLAYYEEDDLELVEKSGVPIVLSPSAILQKETDLPPFEEFNRHGIPIALGTDWGITQPLENIQTYCSILKMIGLTRKKPFDLLAMHTKLGAQALGIENDVGSIEVGKKADIAFLNLADFRMNAILVDESMQNVLDCILHEGASHHVSEVMIHGEFYLREGHLLTYSEDDLSREAKDILSKLQSLGGSKPTAAIPTTNIFQLNPQQNEEKKYSEGEESFEEGFKILRKGTIPQTPREKIEQGKEIRNELSENVRKIFGEDDL